MLSIEVTNTGAVLHAVQGLPGIITRQLVQAMGAVKVLLHQAVAYKLGEGGIIQPRSGNMRRALYSRLLVSGESVAAEVGIDLVKAPQGRLLEYGGAVVPTRSKHLAIPIGEALTARGVARFTARQLIANPQQFGYWGTFVRNNVIFGSIRGAGISPLFALKDSVRIEGRHYLRTSLSNNEQAIQSVLSDGLRLGLQEATQAARG